MYKNLRSSRSASPKMYGLSKIYKTNILLVLLFPSLVQLRTYQLAKFLKQIFAPLVGNTQYTAKNFSEFVELLSSIRFGKSKSQVSSNVIGLFTLVPLETAKTIVANRIGYDCT